MEYNELQADVVDYNQELNKAIAAAVEATEWVQSCKERLDKAVTDLDLFIKDKNAMAQDPI